MQRKWYRMNRHYNLWMILVLEWGGVLLGTFTLNKVFIFVKILVWVIFYKLFFLHNFYVRGNIYTHKMNRHDIEIVDNFSTRMREGVTSTLKRLPHCKQNWYE